MSFITCLILSLPPPDRLTWASHQPMGVPGPLLWSAGTWLTPATWWVGPRWRKWWKHKKVHFPSLSLSVFQISVVRLQRSNFSISFPNFFYSKGALDEMKPITSCSASLNLASMFIYNRRSSIIRIMRRKVSYNGAHNGEHSTPFRRRWAFSFAYVRFEKHSRGYN